MTYHGRGRAPTPAPGTGIQDGTGLRRHKSLRRRVYLSKLDFTTLCLYCLSVCFCSSLGTARKKLVPLKRAESKLVSKQRDLAASSVALGFHPPARLNLPAP